MNKSAVKDTSGELNRQQATVYHVLRTALNNFNKIPDDLEDEELRFVRQEAEKQYEIEQMVLESGEAENVVIPDAFVMSSLDEIKKRYDNDDDYLTDLENNNLSEDLLKTSLYRELKVEAVLDKISANVADVNDLDVRIYYFMHKDKFVQPETRVARHILITINEEFEENTRRKSLEKIIDIQKRVRNKTKRFSEQAKKHSECPTALNGGLVGNIPRGQLFPELDEVLFSLKAGEISEIVESELGYHILFCEKIYQDGPVEYKRAAPAIKDKLLEKRRKVCQRTWLKELSKSSR